MKYLAFFSVILIASSTNAHAAIYSCIDTIGNVATLSVESGVKVTWNQTWDSASSSGQYIGLDPAPFSKTKGYSLFRLTDFYSTANSSFVLALSSLTSTRVKSVVYFDNDDHTEDESAFTCTKN